MLMIDDIRAEHHACTAREASRLLRLTHTVVVGRLVALRERGWVDWTEMTGSLRVTEAGHIWLGTAVEKAPVKKAAAKKAAPKKRNDP